MKKNLNIVSKLTLAGISIIVSSVMFSQSSFATIVDEFKVKNSSKYEEWLMSEDLNAELPSTYNGDLPDELIAEFSKNYIPSLRNDLTNLKDGFSLESLTASYSDASYNLNLDTKVNVKNQMSTNECWAFATISSMETNISLTEKLKEPITFSVRHMDYATTRTFSDGINPIGYGRELGDGGIPQVSFNYLVNGTGAVLESDMPFENNENKISLNEINKKVSRIVTEYQTLPTISKKYDANGNVKYYDEKNIEYSSEELKAARAIIKNHIIKYGAISSTTAANYKEFYNNPDNIINSNSYFCNEEKTRDHAITIVGWDDNYSRNNFNPNKKPKTDGAYIVLNSYGKDVMNNGYYYISYEDYLIEETLMGVVSTSEVDYDNIYQNDFYGGYLPIGADVQDFGYIASVYKRDESKKEVIRSVGITACEYGYYDIYVNPNGTNLNSEYLVKVGETNLISPGYSRINITPTTLEGSSFAIVVKQKAANSGSGFYLPIEVNVPNTVFNYVESKEGTSFISFDGKDWTELADLSGITIVDMSKSDTCLKAFTSESLGEDPDDTPDETPDNPDDKPEEPTDNPNENPDEPTDNPDDKPNDIPVVPDETPDNPDDKPEEPTDNPDDTPDEPTDNPDENPDDKPDEPIDLKISSDFYTIETNYITGINLNTSIVEFKDKIVTNATRVEFYTKDNVLITDQRTVIGTSMKAKFEDKEYTLVVRGDINSDAKITLTDLSKLVAHYNEIKGFILTGDALKASDLNNDGKITLTDLSKLQVIYSNL